MNSRTFLERFDARTMRRKRKYKGKFPKKFLIFNIA